MNSREPNSLQLCSACRGDYEDPDASLADELAEPDDEDDVEERKFS